MRNLEERMDDIRELLSETMKDCKRSLGIIESMLNEEKFDKISFGEAKSIEERVDKFELHIEEEIIKTIARFQPMTINLRFLVSSTKLVISFERINDLALNILKVMKHSDNLPFFKETNISQMLERVQQMFDLFFKAYYEENLDYAYLILSLDEEVNTYKNTFIENLKTGNINKNQLEALFISQHLERIGDEIKNLAESVVYIYKGVDIRHSPLEDSISTKKNKK